MRQVCAAQYFCQEESVLLTYFCKYGRCCLAALLQKKTREQVEIILESF